MQNLSDLERVLRYCSSVVSGDLPSCNYVRLAVDRFTRDLSRGDLFFDASDFESFCGISRLMRHVEGELAGQTFEPEDWQLFIFANIIGLKKKAGGKRKYSYADVYVPRKNGKTFLAAIFASWFLLFDGEAGAKVYTAAVDKEQAKLCYNASKLMIQKLAGSCPSLERRIKVYQWGIVDHANAGEFKPLSKDTKNKDGLNISAAICDERHAWSNNEIYDVIKTGMGARSQPMLLSISTAGTDPSNPYFADIETYKDILLGLKDKDNHFLMLYTPDEGDAWDDPATWAKVNPNLGVSLSRTYMENECAEAKLRGGTYLAAFLTKNLNMWVDAPTVWIGDEDVQACSSPFDQGKLRGEECYVGIDLASKTDITAIAMWFPKHRVLKFNFCVPEEKVSQLEDRVDYRKWAADGWVTVTPGKVLDEEWWVDHLLKILEPYKVRSIAYDPWGMWNLVGKLGRYNEQLMEYRQDIRYMSVPTKWFESAVLKHELNFLGNPVIRWMMKNVVVYTDPNANIKLDKARSRNKIDGVVAAVDAIGGWLNKTGGKSKEIYKTHTLRTV